MRFEFKQSKRLKRSTWSVAIIRLGETIALMGQLADERYRGVEIANDSFESVRDENVGGLEIAMGDSRHRIIDPFASAMELVQPTSKSSH